MRTEQNRKHHSQFGIFSLSITVIVLMLVASVANAAGSSSVISLITASMKLDDGGNLVPNLDDNGNPIASNGNATFSSVTSDGKYVTFDSFAKDLNESNQNTSSSDIFLSVDNGDGTKTIRRIAGSDGGAQDTSKCNQPLNPDRCNSGFPVISHENRTGGADAASTYDIVFSSAATLVYDDPAGGQKGLSGTCGMFGFNCRNIFLAKVDLNNPAVPAITLQRVSLGINNKAEIGNSGYQDLSLITPVNVLHPVAGVYEAQSGDVNGAQPGDAVVVFESDATNLVTGDSNKHKDIFLRDMGGASPSATVRLTKGNYDPKTKTYLQPDGDSSNPVITDDGKYVAFVSTAKNLIAGTSGNPQVYLLDIVNNKIYLVSRAINQNIEGAPANGESRYPSIIENGSVVEVAFHSTSTNLSEAKSGIANIYVYTFDPSKSTETMELVSRGSSPDHTQNAGEVGNMDSLTPYLSSGGGAVTFSSYADNLIEGANNYDCPAITLHGQQVTKCKDIYTSDLSAHQTWRVSLTAAGEQAQSNSAFPSLSGNGRLVSFTSYVDIFGTGGQDYHMQIYQRDQGVPLGNPNIQPSSWNFYAQTNQSSSHVFTVTSLAPSTTLASNAYGGLTLVQGSEQGVQTDNFTLDKQSCTDGLNLATYMSCTFQVTFKATDMGGKNAIVYVPINDDREAVAISLQGKTIVSYLPLFRLY